MYKKVFYIEYMDDMFNILKNWIEDEFYLGFLGFVICGEVGDIIEVIF